LRSSSITNPLTSVSMGRGGGGGGGGGGGLKLGGYRISAPICRTSDVHSNFCNPFSWHLGFRRCINGHVLLLLALLRFSECNWPLQLWIHANMDVPGLSTFEVSCLHSNVKHLFLMPFFSCKFYMQLVFLFLLPFPPTHMMHFLLLLLLLLVQVPFITPFTCAYQFFTLHANLRLPRGYCWCNQRWASQFCAQKLGPHPSTRWHLSSQDTIFTYIPHKCKP